MFLLEEAIINHLREFDFLKGDEPYKFYWTKSSRKYLQVVIMGKGPCARFQINWLNIFLRLHGLRQYSLKDIYYLYLLRRKERGEKKRMGLQPAGSAGSGRGGK